MSSRIRFIGLAIVFFIFTNLSWARVQPRKIKAYGVSYKLLQLINANVAVIPFRNISGVTQATNAITDKFTIYLIRSNLFNVIERERLQEVFREQDQYGLSGRFDDSSLAQAGRILGAQAIFVGTIYEYKPYEPGFFLFARPPKAHIGVRLINTQTGETLWSAEDEFNGFDRSVQKLVDVNDRWRIRSDVDFLATVLCRELVNTLLSTYKKQFELQKIDVGSLSAGALKSTKPSRKESSATDSGVVRLEPPILFETGKADIPKKGREVVRTHLNQMRKYKVIRILIEGYADKSEGNFDSALELSNRRAAAVVTELKNQAKELGYTLPPIISIGYGNEYSKDTNSIVEQQLNRRVDISIFLNDTAEVGQ